MLPKYQIVLFTLITVKISELNSVPQLDLPPIVPGAGDIADDKAKVLPNSYTLNNDRDDDDDDEGTSRGLSSDYDRDRSERFGPPYSLDNIERAPPSNLNDDRLYNDRNNGYNYGAPQQRPDDDDKYHKTPIIDGNIDFDRNRYNDGNNRNPNDEFNRNPNDGYNPNQNNGYNRNPNDGYNQGFNPDGNRNNVSLKMFS